MNYHILDPRFIYHNAASHHKDGGESFKQRMRQRTALAALARQQAAITLIPPKGKQA